MKKCGVFFLIIAILLASFTFVHADSPLTSTNFSEAYQDVEIVQKAQGLRWLDQELAEYLADPENPIDVKAAAISALENNPEGKSNVNEYTRLIYNVMLYEFDHKALRPDEMFCIGYMMAKDDLSYLDSPIKWLEQAKEGMPESLTVALVTAVVKAQKAFYEGKWYSAWQQIDRILKDQQLNQDMRSEAVDIIVDYMKGYSDYFEINPSSIVMEKGQEIQATIAGGEAPFQVKGMRILEEGEGLLYPGAQPTKLVFSPNAQVDIQIDGRTAVFKGMNMGTLLVTLADQNDKTVHIPVTILPKPIEDRLAESVILYLGSPNAYVNNKKTQIDIDNPKIEPVLKNSRTLVPIRFISENFGAKVDWDATTSTAIIKINNKVVKIKSCSDVMLVDGQKVYLDVPAEIIRSRMFIPLRRLAEDALEKQVFYSKGVIILSNEENIIDLDAEKDIVIGLIKKFEGDIGNIRTQGGVFSQVSISRPDGKKLTAQELEEAKRIIAQKFEELEVYGRRLTVDGKNSMILVELSNQYAEEMFTNGEALAKIINTNILTLQELDENKKDQKGEYLQTGKVVMSGEGVLKAEAHYTENGQWVVQVNFTPEAAQQFAEATEKLVGKKIGVFLGDQLLVSPVVTQKITGGNVIISGVGKEESQSLAAMINAGRYPFKFEVTSFRKYNSID